MKFYLKHKTFPGIVAKTFKHEILVFVNCSRAFDFIVAHDLENEWDVESFYYDEELAEFGDKIINADYTFFNEEGELQYLDNRPQMMIEDMVHYFTPN